MDLEGIFIDTWGWMALGHGKERRHAQVKRLFRETRARKTPIFTSDFVLDELITLLFRRQPFEEAVRFIEGIQRAAAAGHLQIDLISKISARLLIRKHPKEKRKKWMEMAGLGSEIWKDVDAQHYVDKERESWERKNTTF